MISYSALVLSGDASNGWKLTANTTITDALTEDKTYNFILTATKSRITLNLIDTLLTVFTQAQK